LRLILSPSFESHGKSVRNFTLYILFLVLMSGLLFAQNEQPKLSSTEKAQAIDSLATNMANNYVFPEIGSKAAALLRANLKKGIYDKITDVNLLAEQLTKDIASFNNDKHLRVFYTIRMLKKRLSENSETATMALWKLKFCPVISGI
jgi:hypothetical protein